MGQRWGENPVKGQHCFAVLTEADGGLQMTRKRSQAGLPEKQPDSIPKAAKTNQAQRNFLSTMKN